MATTITPLSLSNDTGTPAAPNGDGTLINAALFATLESNINALLANPLTISGVLTVDAFGVHQFSAGGTGVNGFRIRNTSAGTGNSAAVTIGNDASAGNAGYLVMYSSTFAGSGASIANGLLIGCGQSGGITINAAHGSGRVRIVGAGETSAPIDSGNKGATLLIADTGGSVGNGGAIEFGAGFPGFNSHFAAIKGWALDGSDATTGHLGIYTRNDGNNPQLTERMRFEGLGGQIQIGDGAVATPALSFLSDTDAGLYLDPSNAVGMVFAGVESMRWAAASSFLSVSVPSTALGSGNVPGPNLFIGYNASGSRAAGSLALGRRDATQRYLWVDTSGDLRIHTAAPTENNTNVADNAGTVVGAQSSIRESKTAIEPFVDYAAALTLIQQVPLHRFRYRNDQMADTHVGIMADEAPMLVRLPAEPGGLGRAFDPINAFGYTAAAIKALVARVEALEAR